MAAHLRNIHFKNCARCSKKATKELRNTFNAIIDWYCASHAAAALKSFEAMLEKERRVDVIGEG